MFGKLMRFPWRGLLARLPLPMLALAASYGVYHFALLFVPAWVAIVQAAAFELVYIGLAVVQLDERQRKRARLISIGAVAASIIYNVLDGLFHRRPQLLEAPELWLDIVLAILHGVPLALLAYFVADLLLHQEYGSTKSLDKTTTGGRPAIFTLDGLVSALPVGETFTREAATKLLGSSSSVADRLLSEAVETGSVERVERGVYRLLA